MQHSLDRSWFAAMVRYLGGIPDNLLVLDLETTGLLHDPSTLVVEIGFCLVRERKPVLSTSVLLDWTRPDYGYPAESVAQRLSDVAYHMAKRGKAYHITLDRLRREGDDPRIAIDTLCDIVDDAVESGDAIVGHNLMAFDRPLIHRIVTQVIGRKELIPATHVIDTMILEKARGLRLPIPDATTPREDWYARVLNNPSRVRCNLDQHCNSVYGLEMDDSKAHAAAYDCEATHRLLEQMRTLAS
jgi:DNA polymerase III epsilon subunit-like protein